MSMPAAFPTMGRKTSSLLKSKNRFFVGRSREQASTSNHHVSMNPSIQHNRIPVPDAQPYVGLGCWLETVKARGDAATS